MRGITAVAVVVFGVLAAGAPAEEGGSARRGGEVLRRHGCLACHALRGGGGTSASDLARRPMPYVESPAGFAAAVWNHAPEMWAEAAARGVEIGELDRAEADDLFAHLWSIRYFDPHGEAIRGKKLFAARGCSGCHEGAARSGRSVPVLEWASLADPVVLAAEMWNHGAAMLDRIREKGQDWPQLSERDVADLLTYLRNLKVAREEPATLDLGAAEEGERLLAAKGCVSCHAERDLGGFGRLEERRFRTLSGFAAALWNHESAMLEEARNRGRELPPLTVDDLRSIVSYLYSRGFFEDCGDPARGRRVFTRRGCAGCHGAAGDTASRLGEAGSRHTVPGLVAALWAHGPRMQAELEARGGRWPRLSERDMADIIAFLNASR